MCGFYNSLHYIIYIYILLMIVYAVLSWIPDLRGGWARYLDALIEPVVAPVRRVIPPIGGLDLSFMVVMFVLYFINQLIFKASINACYGY